MFKNFIATETNLAKYMNPLETACDPEIRLAWRDNKKTLYSMNDNW